MASLRRPPDLAVWALAAAVGTLVGVGLWLIGVPASTLFAGLAARGVVALGSARPPQLPTAASRLAQAVIGTTIGTTVTLPALRAVAAHWVAALTVTVATVGLSILVGLWLARLGGLSRTTGVLAMIAGGASAITATARELGGDDRVVAVVQYLRVLIIIATLPVVTLWLFGTGHAPGAPLRTHLWSDLVLTVASVGIGWLIAVLLPATTMYLLAPMVVATALSLSGWLGVVRVPPLVVAVCFVLLGLQIGLRFTRASLQTIRRLLPAATALIVVVVVASAGLAAVLVWTGPVSGLTAYLATTPGGLPAVLALAAGSGADATYVFALQLARLLLVLAVAPLLTRLGGPGSGAVAADPQHDGDPER